MFQMAPDRWDAVYDWAGQLIRDYMLRYHDPETTQVLDLGVGWGKYTILLPEYREMDAVEIWEPTVETEDLRSRYRRVFVADVYDFVHSSEFNRYDAAIAGDIIEHLPVARAQAVIRKLCDSRVDTLVAIPYRYVQDEEDGNPYQRHIQDDLTPEIAVTRYPELELIAIETRDWRPFKGLYVIKLENEKRW